MAHTTVLNVFYRKHCRIASNNTTWNRQSDCSVLASKMEAIKLIWTALGDNSQCQPNGNFSHYGWPRITIRACFRLEVHWSRTKSTDYSNCSLLFKRSLFSSIVHITKRCINLPFQTQTKMGKKRKISRRKKSFFLWKVNLKRVKTLKKKSSVVLTVY